MNNADIRFVYYNGNMNEFLVNSISTEFINNKNFKNEFSDNSENLIKFININKLIEQFIKDLKRQGVIKINNEIFLNKTIINKYLNNSTINMKGGNLNNKTTGSNTNSNVSRNIGNTTDNNISNIGSNRNKTKSNNTNNTKNVSNTTASNTLSNTPTNTSSNTPSNISSNTPSNTSSNTPSNTSSNKANNTLSNTPTNISSNTPSNTSSNTSSNKASNKPSNTKTSNTDSIQKSITNQESINENNKKPTNNNPNIILFNKITNTFFDNFKNINLNDIQKQNIITKILLFNNQSIYADITQILIKVINYKNINLINNSNNLEKIINKIKKNNKEIINEINNNKFIFNVKNINNIEDNINQELESVSIINLSIYTVYKSNPYNIGEISIKINNNYIQNTTKIEIYNLLNVINKNYDYNIKVIYRIQNSKK